MSQERINQIIKLSHTGREADEAQYKALQPELLQLMAQQEGRAVSGHTSSQVAQYRPSDAVAASVNDIPMLPGDHSLSPLDHRLWNSVAIPAMVRARLTTAQASQLGDAYVEGARRKEAEQAEELKSARALRQRDTHLVLRDRHGASYATQLKEANDFLESTKEHDLNIRVGDFVLSDGSKLGDHPAYISQNIALANRARRSGGR